MDPEEEEMAFLSRGRLQGGVRMGGLRLNKEPATRAYYGICIVIMALPGRIKLDTFSTTTVVFDFKTQ